MDKPKRKRYFIDKKLQTKYIIVTILLLFIYTFLFVVILLAPYIMSLTFDSPVEEQKAAAKALLVLHNSIWPALGAVMLIMASGSLLITHRMAGPVYHIKRDLGEVSAGNLDVSIKLRDKDDLKDLAESINMVLVKMRTFAQTLQDNAETMSVCINEVEEQIKVGKIDSEIGAAIIDRMSSSRENISQVLAKDSEQSI